MRASSQPPSSRNGGVSEHSTCVLVKPAANGVLLTVAKARNLRVCGLTTGSIRCHARLSSVRSARPADEAHGNPSLLQGHHESPDRNEPLQFVVPLE